MGESFAVSGGPVREEQEGRFPTVIEGKVDGGKLVVYVHDVLNGKVVERYEYGA